MSRNRVTIAAIAAAGLLAGCAPDAWNAQSSFDQYLDTVAKKCYPLQLGQYLISDLIYGSSSYFMDEASRLYYGRISQASFRDAMVAFSNNSAATHRGVDCIIAQLPSAPPGSPGMTPFLKPAAGGQGNVPPPPPSK